MREITIKGKKIKIGCNDSEFAFRYSEKGGLVEFLEGKEIPSEKSFFCLVTFVWAMLKEDSQVEYPTPVSMADLFYPEIDTEALAKIRELLHENKKS